jgi:hypothetical protein
MNNKQFLVSKLTESEKWAILTWAEDHIDRDVAVRLWRDKNRGGLLMAEVRPVEPKQAGFSTVAL